MGHESACGSLPEDSNPLEIDPDFNNRRGDPSLWLHAVRPKIQFFIDAGINASGKCLKLGLGQTPDTLRNPSFAGCEQHTAFEHSALRITFQ